MAKIYINSQVVEQVKQFKYLESVITDQKMDTATKTIRVESPWKRISFMTKKKLLTSKMDLRRSERELYLPLCRASHCTVRRLGP